MDLHFKAVPILGICCVPPSMPWYIYNEWKGRFSSGAKWWCKVSSSTSVLMEFRILIIAHWSLPVLRHLSFSFFLGAVPGALKKAIGFAFPHDVLMLSREITQQRFIGSLAFCRAKEETLKRFSNLMAIVCHRFSGNKKVTTMGESLHHWFNSPL